MSARCMRCADGSVEYFVGLVLDTTERKRAEEKLRRSEANLADGQRISQTGSWSANLSTGEIYCSQELLRIFGLPTEGMVSREMFLDLVHPEDRKHVRQAFDHAVSIKSKYENTYRIVGPDGEIKYIHALSHPVFQESGEAKEYVGTVIDITERKRAEERLQNAQADLAHVTRLTTMVELAASIAHEINQPLGAVVNNGNVALRLATGAKESRRELVDVLSDIVNDANRASAIIASIRAVMLRSTLEKTSLQLNDLVADVLALAQHQLAERGIAVCTELPEDLPSVSGDRIQLQQVLLNLVMNAIDAMSELDKARRILTIGGGRDDLAGQPAVVIAVRDFGNGFSPEDKERLFDAFYTTKPEGMGMGLRISRSIVEAHGGRLWAQVNEDIGATFLFALPVDD
jgi:PAS domain S-box-containing protein